MTPEEAIDLVGADLAQGLDQNGGHQAKVQQAVCRSHPPEQSPFFRQQDVPEPEGRESHERKVDG